MALGDWGMLYKNVQGLRAIAASLVVIAHSGCVMYVPNAVFTLGVSGVDIFFVISGFIICQAASRPNTGVLHFLGRRCWRIFPIYWIVLAFSVAIGCWGITWAEWMTARHSALSYILLLTTENRYVPQAWTLVFELYFYASLAVVLLVSPPGRFYRTLAVWIVAQLALIILCGADGGPPVNAMSLEFALGCAVAWLNQRNLIRYELVAWGLGLLFFAGGVWWFVQVAPMTPVSRLLTFGVGAALCLYALVGLERRGYTLCPSVIMHLGDASYSLYLWHLPLFAVLMTLGIRKVGAVSLILVAALASYYLIEAPLLRLDAPKQIQRVISEGIRAAQVRSLLLARVVNEWVEELRLKMPSLARSS
jgi:exopolysaccharide production protein ExoZ